VVTLSKNQQLKLEVVVKVCTGIMSRQKAVQLLQCTERTLRRYIKDYRERDIMFVKHKNAGKTPHNKTNPEIKEMALFLIKNKYYDFNILHLQEKLKEHGLDIKRETLRKWSHEINMVKKKKRRRSKARYYRERMAKMGVLIQMDGSYHQWFGNDKYCLIAAVDDATSEILFAKFYQSENTEDCMDFFKRLIEKHGAFENLYVDKAGVYGGIKRSGFSQVERAMGEIGTHVIYAHSPQGKGRIERLFNTLQDRLIPELRLNKVITLEAANSFLEEYLKTHNNKFSVQAKDSVSAFYRPHKCLEEVFCIKEYRQVNSDHTISFRGEKYMISERFKYSIKKQSVEIRIKKNGDFTAYFGDYKINIVKIEKINKIAA
jgi:transposase-like protein